MTAETFRIKGDYEVGSRRNRTLAHATKAGDLPDVFALAKRLGKLTEATQIIHIGCGDGTALIDFCHHFRIMGVDTPDLVPICEEQFPAHDWVAVDFENFSKTFLEGTYDLSRSLIVCTGVLEQLANPQPLLDWLMDMSHRVQGVLLATPERDLRSGIAHKGPPENTAHVREWRVSEFRDLLRSMNAHIAWEGLTCCHAVGEQRHSMAFLLTPEKSTLHETLRAGAANLGLDHPGESEHIKSRVCLATNNITGMNRNGVGTANASLAVLLAADGHDMTILYTGDHLEDTEMEKWTEYYANFKVKFKSIPERQVEQQIYLNRAWDVYQYLLEQDRREPYDVIHFSECQAHGYWTLLAKSVGEGFHNTNLTVTPHGSLRWCLEGNHTSMQSFEELCTDHIERRCLEFADLVIGPSSYMLDWISRQGWSLPKRHFVQQYVLPVKPETTLLPDSLASKLDDNSQALSEGEPITELVFFGRLEIRKGIVLFVDALDQLRDALPQDLKITFMGEPWVVGEESSQEYLDRRGLHWKNEWQILDGLNQLEAMDYIKSPGRMAIMASLQDNLPNTVMECLGLQIPFIASQAGGIQELIAPEDVARCTFPLNHDPATAMAQVIQQILNRGNHAPARMAVPPTITAQSLSTWHSRMATRPKRVVQATSKRASLEVIDATVTLKQDLQKVTAEYVLIREETTTLDDNALDRLKGFLADKEPALTSFVVQQEGGDARFLPIDLDHASLINVYGNILGWGVVVKASHINQLSFDPTVKTNREQIWKCLSAAVATGTPMTVFPHVVGSSPDIENHSLELAPDMSWDSVLKQSLPKEIRPVAIWTAHWFKSNEKGWAKFKKKREEALKYKGQVKELKEKIQVLKDQYEPKSAVGRLFYRIGRSVRKRQGKPVV